MESIDDQNQDFQSHQQNQDFQSHQQNQDFQSQQNPKSSQNYMDQSNQFQPNPYYNTGYQQGNNLQGNDQNDQNDLIGNTDNQSGNNLIQSNSHFDMVKSNNFDNDRQPTG